MSSTVFTANGQRHAFNQRVKELHCPKSDINALILDYLTMEGYSNAAAKFSKEANMQPLEDPASIRARQEIQQSILAGKFSEAIEALNDLDPQILDEDESLHFSLLRLQLVELIRNCNVADGDIGHALKFAQEQLGPRAPVNPAFLEDLEKTMALLLIPQADLEPPLAALLDPSLRRVAADRVNMAIMERREQRTVAGIRNLVKMRCWAENRARDAGIAVPDSLPVGLHGEGNEGSLENGHDAIIPT